MTMARIQPCLRKLGFDLGFYNGDRVFPRTVTNRDSALYLYKHQFCLIWKAEGVSFTLAINELKNNFKIVENYITEENVTSHFKYEFNPNKIESHLTNFIVYDLETHNTNRARPYLYCFYRLSKLAGRCNRDLTRDEIDNCKRDTIAFDGDDCVEKVLDFCLKLKGEEYKDKKGKVFEYNLQLHAHNGSGFDSRIVLYNLPCDKKIVNIFKNGKGIIELKVFNGYFEKKIKNKFLTFFILDVVRLI